MQFDVDQFDLGHLDPYQIDPDYVGLRLKKSV